MPSSHWEPSKWLIQSAPPDMGEGRKRWTFGVYEILDRRRSPVDPRIIHAMYRGVVELDPSEIGDPADAMFTPRLEESVIKKWKQMQIGG